jgi:hypothetical protein
VTSSTAGRGSSAHTRGVRVHGRPAQGPRPAGPAADGRPLRPVDHTRDQHGDVGPARTSRSTGHRDPRSGTASDPGRVRRASCARTARCAGPW